MARFKRLLFAAIMTPALATAVHAQLSCPPAWVPGIGVPGVNSTVNALAVLPNGDAIAGGQLTAAGGQAVARIARYTPSTGLWSPLGAGTDFQVDALAVLPGGDLIVGGGFTAAGGAPANLVARWAPATSTWSPLGAGVGGVFAEVFALAVLPPGAPGAGEVIAGGFFTQAGTVAAKSVARYNPATNLWSALGPGIDNSGIVNALAVLPGGDIIVGGTFSVAGGVGGRNNIARYSPGTGAWSSLGGGASARVLALAVLPGGDVIVGGQFVTVNGSGSGGSGGLPAAHIARYSPITGVWSALGAGANFEVDALLTLPGGDVMLGGGFSMAGGLAANSVARVNPTANSWTGLGAGAASGVSALAVLSASDAIVGGRFSFAGGQPAGRIARFTLGNSCPVDYNCSGTLGVQDIFDFLAGYFAADPRADFNHAAGISVQDIFDFLASYFAGCG